MNEIVDGIGIDPVEVKICEAEPVRAVGAEIIGEVDDLEKPILEGEIVVGYEKKMDVIGHEEGEIVGYKHPDVRIASLPETTAGDVWELTVKKNGEVVSATEYTIDPRVVPDGQIARAVTYMNFVNDVPAKE